jgi:hypothetical protein
VERGLAAGKSRETVAREVGVSLATVARWLARGKVKRPGELTAVGQPPRKTPPEDTGSILPPCPPPAAVIARVERLEDAEVLLEGALVRAAREGDWRAAAWALERLRPERWGKERVSAGAVAKDEFADLDELAAKRRGA